MRSIVRTVGPTLEPVTVAEMIRHLRLDAGHAEPAPSAPTVALAGAGAGNVDNGAHRYRVTFVTASGETDGGTISSAVTVVDKTTNGKVALTAIPLGSAVVTARKIYRTVAAGSTYLLVTTLADNTTTTYTDNTADSGLGVEAPSINSTNDDEILGVITSARETVEAYLHRPLLRQTFRITLDEFPCEGIIRLPQPRLLDVTSVEYRDTVGTWTTLSTDIYEVDTDAFPGEIRLKYLQIWPLVYAQPASIRITFRSGYGTVASDVPVSILSGLKLIATDLWENRELTNIGNIVNALPGVKRCLDPHRYMEMV